ncbi:MAG: DUF1553 domain-containing protein [Verrucomicrobiota bacterium]
MMFRFAILFLLSGGTLVAVDREELQFFETEIRPLLAEACFDCHDGGKQKGDLRLDHLSWMLKGGNSGPALVPGKPNDSLLIQVVKRSDPDFAMPPKESMALPASQVSKLEQWIARGAPWPEDPGAEVAEQTDEHGFTASDRAWWAVQPVKDPSPPEHGQGWVENEIDHFLARKLAEAGLKPAARASREELVRRVYFDLHGLPPTPEQVSAFVSDERPDAYRRLIDELLASSRYGERWAQHWLDVVRFAESDGYRADDFRPGVWKYRDYVIRSLNEDKPFDQLIREQLAADEFARDDPNTLIATAFLRLGIYEWNQRNARMQWDLILTEMTNATAEAFLGIGIGCAQCHDHKFDPILQKDFYALQSFLNTVWWPEDHDLVTKEERKRHGQRAAEWEVATREVRDKILALQQRTLMAKKAYTVGQFPDDIQTIYEKPTEKRSANEEQLAQLVQRQVDHQQRRIKWEKEFGKDKDKLDELRALEAELASFDPLKPDPLPNGFIATDVKPEPAMTYLSRRSGKEVVEPAFLTLLGQPAPVIEPGESTTGRRTALADWIADPANPLSTRVIVNRIWQRHFGMGLVATPNDFGMLGEPPSHPELLDWLTHRFLEGGWRWKELHRLILTSATYQQTARREPSEREHQIDPGNRLLWRFPPKRLDAEQIRDAMLAVSGELKHREGGPSVDGTSLQRSIYVKKRRNSPDPMMGGLDAPAGFASAANRTETTTPTQSLLLVNGEWVLDRARAMARELLEKGTQAEQVKEGYLRVYGRDASSAEVETAVRFLNGPRPVDRVAIAAEKVDKFPNETGLRPISQLFAKVREAGLDLGENALWLQPGSRFEQLHLAETELEGDSFTVEAVVSLDTIHKDASVNTLVSRWNGNQRSPGWTFGVTSAKSRYQPRNLIVQLIGSNVAGGTAYEVVASGLRVPLQTPVYLAAVVSAQDRGNVGGTVRFYLKDLSMPNAELQSIEIPHSISQKVQKQETRLVTGGRDQKGHLWDGQVARLALTDRELSAEELLFRSQEAVADFKFTRVSGDEPAPGSHWERSREKIQTESQEFMALADFCHALLNSNEFLYLH